MALNALILKFSDLRKRSRMDACVTAEPQEERKTMPVPQPRPRRRKPLDAGPFAREIGSFRLHLAAEGKAAKTVRTYTEAVAWFAAAHLIPRTGCMRWEQVSGHDGQRWLVHLLTRYSDAYASNQFCGATAKARPARKSTTPIRYARRVRRSSRHTFAPSSPALDPSARNMHT
jgi:hypothetical protein